jgi:DnaK suppressor protein
MLYFNEREEYMTTTLDLQKFRTLLEQQRTELQDELARLQAETADANEDEEGMGVSNHPADDATDTFTRERNIAVSGDLDQELEDVERALQRIEDGTYGKCAVDGEPISVERLEARPAATMCIEHQREQESQQDG